MVMVVAGCGVGNLNSEKGCWEKFRLPRRNSARRMGEPRTLLAVNDHCKTTKYKEPEGLKGGGRGQAKTSAALSAALGPKWGIGVSLCQGLRIQAATPHDKPSHATSRTEHCHYF